MNVYYSEYYERAFSEPEIDNAILNYLAWNRREGMQPEVEGTDREDWQYHLETVLYHAEIEQQIVCKGLVNYSRDVVINAEKYETQIEARAKEL